MIIILLFFHIVHTGSKRETSLPQDEGCSGCDNGPHMSKMLKLDKSTRGEIIVVGQTFSKM